MVVGSFGQPSGARLDLERLPGQASYRGVRGLLPETQKRTDYIWVEHL